MSTITTKDGTPIYYNDWGNGPPVVFSHGWPLSGDDDQIVPIANSELLTAKLVKGATLKVYKGAPHGICTTHKDQINEELLAFIKSGARTARAGGERETA